MTDLESPAAHGLDSWGMGPGGRLYGQAWRWGEELRQEAETPEEGEETQSLGGKRLRDGRQRPREIWKQAETRKGREERPELERHRCRGGGTGTLEQKGREDVPQIFRFPDQVMDTHRQDPEGCPRIRG